jgi:hypothetical protein
MTIKKTTKMTYDKIINGQKVTFNYEYTDSMAPVNINISAPVTVQNDPGQASNGYINANVVVANKEDAKAALSALITSVFGELDNVITNYTNPETV